MHPRTLPDPIPAPSTLAKPRCPCCTARLGDRHAGSCRIFGEVIIHRDRPQPVAAVQPQDLAVAGCGCSRILVDALGPRGGHTQTCRRQTWITATTEPAHLFRPGTNQQLTVGCMIGWLAVWTDSTVSRHGIHLPDHAAAFRTSNPFGTWDDAAAFLDDLRSDMRPLGVFVQVLPAKDHP